MSHRMPPPRRGLLIVPVLVAMLLASMLATQVVTTGIRHRRHADRLIQQRQTDWLARAGLESALQRIASETPGELDGRRRDYSAALPRFASATVRYAARPTDGDPNQVQLVVTATIQRGNSVTGRTVRSIRRVVAAGDPAVEPVQTPNEASGEPTGDGNQRNETLNSGEDNAET